MKRTPRWLKVAAALLVLFVGYRWFFGAPTEAQMLSNFRTHRREFEELRAMLQHDKRIESIYPNSSEVLLSYYKRDGVDYREEWTTDLRKIGLTPQRFARYQQLLQILNVNSAVCSRSRNSLRLGVFGGGFYDATWDVGYAWLATPPKILVRSAYSQLPMRDHGHCSRIEGDWYLYQRR